MKTSSLSRRFTAGLTALFVALAGMVFAATPAHAAFGCDDPVIDGAQSLSIEQEASVEWWAQIFPMNGIELHIVTAPNLNSDGQVVPDGEEGGGPDVDPLAIQYYMMSLKETCPGWSAVDETTNEPRPKDNLIIIAVAPENTQMAYIQGDGVKMLNDQEVGELFDAVINGYESGHPEDGFRHALMSLAMMLFMGQWLLLFSAAGVTLILAIVLVTKVIKGRQSSRS